MGTLSSQNITMGDFPRKTKHFFNYSFKISPLPQRIFPPPKQKGINVTEFQAIFHNSKYWNGINLIEKIQFKMISYNGGDDENSLVLMLLLSFFMTSRWLTLSQSLTLFPVLLSLFSSLLH